MPTIIVEFPETERTFGCRYEVLFRNGKAEAVARDPKAFGPKGALVDVWRKLKGSPTPDVQRIIEMARAKMEG